MRLIFILLLLCPLPANPQKKSTKATAERGDTARRLQDAFREATDEYKESLKQLITHYERNRERAIERLKKTQELYDASLVSGRAVAEEKENVAAAESDLARAKTQLEHVDDEIKKLLEESAALERSLMAQPATRERTPAGRVYYVRFVIVGEIVIYDYSGAVRGQVIKQGNRVRYDSRKK